MSFIHDITIGQYYPSNSLIHQLDPRSKSIILLTIMIFLVLNINLFIYLFFSLFLFCVIYFSGISYKIVFKNLRPFLWLFLLTFILNAINYPGKILFTIPIINLDISEEGMIRATAFSIRLVLLIGYSTIFTLTTTPMELADGLSRMLGPFKKLKLPVNEFAMMLTLAIRFIPILLEEAERIKIAQVARGAHFNGKFIQRIRNLIPLLVPLFISSFRKADDIALAMESRCFQIGKERTSFSKLHFKFLDYASIAGVFLIAVFITVI